MPETFLLGPQQLEAFGRRGVLRLPRFYAKADIDRMADRLWADLATRFGMQRDQPTSWTVPFPAGFQKLKQSGAFSPLGSPALFALADALLGAGNWDPPALWGGPGGPLVSFPTPVPSLKRPPWHLDIGGTEWLDPLPTLRVFTFLEPVPPQGGGTLYVAGSHRFAIDMERVEGARLKSAQVRDRLKAAHPWFASLFAASNDDLPARIDVEVQVGTHCVALEEMTGAPGDLIVMHPAILHGTAHNAGNRPRLMLTEWISRRVMPSARDERDSRRSPAGQP